MGVHFSSVASACCWAFAFLNPTKSREEGSYIIHVMQLMQTALHGGIAK